MGNQKRLTRQNKQIAEDELKTRLEAALQEINAVLTKHRVMLNPQLSITPKGITPIINLIDNGNAQAETPSQSDSGEQPKQGA
jgi:hypothetical protein